MRSLLEDSLEERSLLLEVSGRFASPSFIVFIPST